MVARRKLLYLTVSAWTMVACGGYEQVSMGLRNNLIGANSGSDGSDEGVTAQVRAAGEANNQFAVQLLHELSKRKCKCVGNQVFAPVSVTTTLAMLAAGARGDTAAQMTSVLGYSELDAMNNGVSALEAATQGIATSETEFQAANRLWTADGVAVRQSYQETLKALYRADTGVIPSGDPEAARLAINGWVASQTDGMIKELLAPGANAASARLILTNALFLRAKWARPFASSATTDELFVGEMAPRTVRMMHQDSVLYYAETPSLRLLELPYAQHRLVMNIALTADGSDAALWHNPDLGRAMQEAIGNLEARRVSVSIPAFEVRAPTHLPLELQKLGMAAAFSKDADFSGITDEPGLTLGDVVHEAFLSVTERGTEAGASTAGMVFTSNPAGGPVEFKADRPFVYAIRDRVTGAYLFLGVFKGPDA